MNIVFMKLNQEKIINQKVDINVLKARAKAIQDKENYPPLIRRQKIITKTAWLNKISSLLLYAGIPAILATGALPFIRICVLIIFASILITPPESISIPPPEFISIASVSVLPVDVIRSLPSAVITS